VPAKTRHRAFVPPPAPRTPKSQRTREQLLRLAGELFIERGYAAVSIRDIADAAGLTNGAVYGHFRTKGQLLVEVIRGRLAASDASIDFEALADDPARGVELMFDKRYRDIRVLEVDAAAAARHDPDVAAGLSHLYAERDERIRAAMEELDDPAAGAWIVFALTAGIAMKEAAQQPLLGRDRMRAALLRVIESLA
jgi:AcrR family transcriptional regulator